VKNVTKNGNIVNVMIKEHPYDYLNAQNFDLVKKSLEIGLRVGKTPTKIAELMAQSTGLDYTVCYAIVQEELLNTMKSLEKKNG